jgi:hypothetical protein
MPRNYARSYRRPRKAEDADAALARLLEPRPVKLEAGDAPLTLSRPNRLAVWLMAFAIVLGLAGIAGVLALRMHYYGQTASSATSP